MKKKILDEIINKCDGKVVLGKMNIDENQM